MKNKRATLLQILLFLGIGTGLIIWQYRAMDLKEREDMLNALRQVRYIYFIPAFIMGFLSHYFRALRWKLLLKPIDIRPATINTLFAVLIGYLVNALVLRLGEVAKCTVLAKYENAAPDKMVGTILAERAFDMLCFLILFGITLALQYDIIHSLAYDMYRKTLLDQAGHFIWKRLLITAGIGMVLLITFIFIYKKILHSKVGAVITRILLGLKSILLVKEKGAFLLYTVLIWSLYTAIAILGFYMLPGMEHLSWLAGLSVIAIGTVTVIITPGGIGVFPPIIASILLLYGISQPLGNAYGWVNWSIQTITVLVLGLISLLLLPIYNRNRNVGKNRNHPQ